jgi:hypothetical protein
MKAANSVQLLTTSEAMARRLVQPFQTEVQGFSTRKAELEALAPGPLKANLALEYARDVKALLAAFEKSEARKQLLALYHAHRYFSGVARQLVIDPADDLLKLCNRIRSEWEIQRRQRIAEDRRQRESQLQLDMQIEREQEAQHLRELGRVDEAEALTAEPLPAVTLNVDEDAGKPQDESMVEVWAPARDEQDEIVFTDRQAFLTWIAATPPMQHLVSPEFGKLKKLLTDNRGLLQPPGLKVEHRFEPRTRQVG